MIVDTTSQISGNGFPFQETVLGILTLIIGGVIGHILSARSFKLKVSNDNYNQLLNSCAELQADIVELISALDADSENNAIPAEHGGGINLDRYDSWFRKIKVKSSGCILRCENKKLNYIFEEIISIVSAPEQEIQAFRVTDDESFYENFEKLIQDMSEAIKDLADQMVTAIKKAK